MTYGQPDRNGSLFEIAAILDPQDVEALRLELRRLAKEHGAEIRDIRVRSAFEGSAMPADPWEELALPEPAAGKPCSPAPRSGFASRTP